MVLYFIPVLTERGDFQVETTFAQRLVQACDDSVTVPEFGKGRQVAIAKRLSVTQEAVRKWFAGEALPRPQKMKELAEFLEVDEAWLALGVKPDIDRSEKRTKRKLVDGAVHIISGMVMLEGGQVAFPSDRDPQREYVDLYAILRGTQMSLYVSVASELSAGRYEFIVPRQYDTVRCVGFIAQPGGNYQLIDMPSDVITEHKARKSGDYAISVNKIENKYFTGKDELTRFRHLAEII